MVFWHPKGWTLWRVLEAYMRRRLDAAGYVEVKTPQVLDRTFWEKSGHWEKYRAQHVRLRDGEGEILSLKPMNCPGHVQIFKHGQKSYRELPLRMAEFGACHRYEPSGALHGLMRVRGFTQDDAHIFCREDQIVEETAGSSRWRSRSTPTSGMETDYITLATRPEVRAGSDEFWDKAEARCCGGARRRRRAGDRRGRRRLLRAQAGLRRQGRHRPRVDLRHAAARLCPARAAGRGIRRRGRPQARPVMLHRAILGSFERFIGIMIENYAGAFPLWLAPVQVVVATITSDADDYAEEAAPKLRKAGLRVRDGPAQREDQLQGPRALAGRSRSSPWSARRRPRRARWRSAARVAGAGGRVAGRGEGVPRGGSAAAGSETREGVTTKAIIAHARVLGLRLRLGLVDLEDSRGVGGRSDPVARRAGRDGGPVSCDAGGGADHLAHTVRARRGAECAGCDAGHRRRAR